MASWGLPMWITEFGVLDHGQADHQAVAQYVQNCLDDAGTDPRVQAVVYFGWGDQTMLIPRIATLLCLKY